MVAHHDATSSNCWRHALESVRRRAAAAYDRLNTAFRRWMHEDDPS